MAKMKGRAQFQSWPLLPRKNTVDDVDRVLQMQHQHPLFHNEVAHVVRQDGKANFEREHDQVNGRRDAGAEAGRCKGSGTRIPTRCGARSAAGKAGVIPIVPEVYGKKSQPNGRIYGASR